MRSFKGGASSNAYNNQQDNSAQQNHSNIKLARTGIEQVFCTERPRFIELHREFERIATVNVSVSISQAHSGASLVEPSCSTILHFVPIYYVHSLILSNFSHLQKTHTLKINAFFKPELRPTLITVLTKGLLI